MPLLTVFVTTGSEPEAQHALEAFFSHLEEGDVGLEGVELSLLRKKDVEGICGKSSDTVAAVKSFEQYITGQSKKQNNNNNNNKKELKSKKSQISDVTELLKIILVEGFPNTVDQLKVLVESSSDFPVLDAIVRLVMRMPGEDMASSEMGPETTVKPDFDKLITESCGSVSDLKSVISQSNLVSDLDIESYLASSHDYHGGHITLDDINAYCAENSVDGEDISLVPRPPQNILSDFVQLCAKLSSIKEKYYDWAKETKTYNVKFDSKVAKKSKAATCTIAVNEAEGVWKTEPLYNAYRGFVNLLPTDCQSAGGVLFSMVQSIVYNDVNMDEKAQVFNCVDFSSFDCNTAQYVHDGVETSFERNGSSAGLLDGVIRSADMDDGRYDSDLVLVDEGDSNAYRAIHASRYLSVAGDPSKSLVNAIDSATDESLSKLEEGSLSLPNQNACAGLLQFENEAVFRAQVPRLLGQGGLPLHPTISPMDRSIQESELLTFSSFSAHDIHRYNILQIFDDMLQNSIPRLANFTGQQIGATIENASITKRKFYRKIPGFALPQILARELDTEPTFIRDYYPLTDQLLLGMLWIPPHRRMGLKEWNPSLNMHIKPTFDQYLIMQERQNFTPRTAGGLKASINISKGHLKKFHQRSCVITPSDNSMVMMKHMISTGESWLSVYLKNTMFGLRVTPKQLSGLKKLPSQMESAREKPKPKAEGDIDAASEQLSISSLEKENGEFVCNTDDNVRMTVSIVQKSEELRKPDGKCFVKMHITYLNGLVAHFCSDGVISFYSAPLLQTPKSTDISANANIHHPYGFETCRHFINGGIVTRHIGGPYIFCRDILFPDGSRILIRGDQPSLSDPNATKEKPKALSKKKSSIGARKRLKAIEQEKLMSEASDKPCPDPYLMKLFDSAPSDWRFVCLDESGAISFYNSEPGATGAFDERHKCVHDSNVTNIRSSYIDAETRSHVHEYKDGRIITLWADDDLREARFLDGTRIMTHLKTNIVYIEKEGLPGLEFDVDVDKVSKKHSKGIQVPIAKGGERTRCRVAMPDGTAVFIKYNTKITARFNGSIKAVRRNHEVVLAEDGGVVTYLPSTAWSDVSDKEFSKDSLDDAVPRKEVFKSRQSTANESTTSKISPKAKKKVARFQNTDRSEQGNVFHHTMQKSRKGVGGRDISVTSECAGLSSACDSIAGSIDSLAKQQAFENTTTYTFNLAQSSCTIKDHENNIFDLELSKPSEPHLQLAGEIEGLKPKAVSESATEPRLFIIGRDGNAEEIVRNETLDDLEMCVQTSPDYNKEESPAEYLSCDLGNTKSHAYFLHQRTCDGKGVSFQEIFGRRYWHNYMAPATAALRINKMANSHLNPARMMSMPRVFETQVITEYSPLSQEGYQQLSKDFENWRSWRKKRIQSMEKYTFNDPRTEEDLQNEKDMTSRVKKAYKAAKNKAAALRKKEKEREKHQQVQQSDHMSCVEEDMDEEKEFSSDDEHEFADDPETLEIVEAFNNFGVHYDIFGGTEVRLPIDDCRNALVQCLNRFVSENEVSTALLDECMSTALTLDQFRRLFFIIKNPDVSGGSQYSSDNSQLRRATRTHSVPMLSRNASMSSFKELDVEGVSAAGSAVHAARLSKTTTAQ